MVGSRAAKGLAAMLATVGTVHFISPSSFDDIVPHLLPGSPRDWTYLSGAAELAVAATVAVPRTRRVGGLLAAALFVAVFPGNLQMAWDWRHRPAPEPFIAYARLPLQIPLVLWALHVARTAAISDKEPN